MDNLYLIFMINLKGRILDNIQTKITLPLWRGTYQHLTIDLYEKIWQELYDKLLSAENLYENHKEKI